MVVESARDAAVEGVGSVVCRELEIESSADELRIGRAPGNAPNGCPEVAAGILHEFALSIET